MEKNSSESIQYTPNEKMVIQNIIKDWIDIISKDIKVKELENWLILVISRNQVFAYRQIIDWKVKNYLNIREWLKKTPLFKDMLRYTWYEFIWEKLYKKSDIKDWSPNQWAKEVDIFSMEYFNVMNDTNFYIDSFYKSEMVRRAENWNEEYSEDEINRLIKYNKIRLKDFLYFRQEWRINDEMYKKYLPVIKSKLLEQCADTRYDVFKWEWTVFSVVIEGKNLKAENIADIDVTENEIKYYFENWYIDADLSKKAIEIIQAKAKREAEEDRIRSGTKERIDLEKKR